MAIPGGYNRTTAIQLYSGQPVDYQIQVYLNKIGASGGQVSGMLTVARTSKGGHASWDDTESYLTNH